MLLFFFCCHKSPEDFSPGLLRLNTRLKRISTTYQEGEDILQDVFHQRSLARRTIFTFLPKKVMSLFNSNNKSVNTNKPIAIKQVMAFTHSNKENDVKIQALFHRFFPEGVPTPKLH